MICAPAGFFQAGHGHDDRPHILLAASCQADDQEHDRTKAFST